MLAILSIVARRKPAGLGPAGAAFWSGVNRDYELSAPEIALLERACRTLDLLALCDAELASGVMIEGSQGQMRGHPLIAAVTELSRVFNVQLQSLALPYPGEAYGSVRSPQRHAAAQRRWRMEHNREVGV